MNLEKAIQITSFERKATLPPRNDDFWNAVQLEEEATKRLLANRQNPEFDHYLLLPGETED